VQGDRGACRSWQRALLALALILGVVGMHAVSACPDNFAFSNHMSASSAQDSHMATSQTSPVGGLVVLSSAEAHQPPDGSQSPGAPESSALHHLLHICVAILIAALVIGVAVLLALVVTPRGLHRQRITRVLQVCVPPPLPTSVRLAQLCVLRN
jgi:hypothetical protein